MKPLDRQIVDILAKVHHEPGPAPGADPADVRARFSARIAAEVLGGTRPEVTVTHLSVGTRAGPLPARLYRPETRAGDCGIVFFHSGGFVIGDLDTGEPVALAFLRHTGWPVLSIGYRLAPEYPFPAAVEDAIDATQWAAARLVAFGPRVRRLVVAGDSAGGNLAAVVAQSVGFHSAVLAAQCLLYPGLIMGGSMPDNSDDPFIDAAAAAWFSQQYLGDQADPNDPRVSPALSEQLAGLAPAVFGVSARDPLTAGSVVYQAALTKVGVPTRYRSYEDLPHGFAEFDGVSRSAEAAMREICSDLRQLASAGMTQAGLATGETQVPDCREDQR